MATYHRPAVVATFPVQRLSDEAADSGLFLIVLPLCLLSLPLQFAVLSLVSRSVMTENEEALMQMPE